MAESPEVFTKDRVPTGQLILGILATAVALAGVLWILIQRGRAADWNGVQTGLALISGVCALAAAWVWSQPLSIEMDPTGRTVKPAVQAIGLFSVFATVVLLLVFGVDRIANQEAASGDWIRLGLAALGFAVGVATWWSPIQRSMSQRGVMLQVNAGIMLLLTVGVIVLVTKYLIPNHLGFIKADLTSEKYYSLSEQTINVVRGLKPEDAVEIIGIVPRDTYASRGDLQVMAKRLEEYDRLSPNLTVQTLDPYLNPEAQALIREGALSSDVGAVIRKKNDPKIREGVTSTEEADITRAIIKLLHPSSRKLYFLTGHGELPLEGTDPMGLSTFKTILENDRWEATALELFKQERVPEDAAALVVAAPKLVFQADELEKIRTYLNGGGRMIAFLDPLNQQTNFGDLLAEYGMEWHPLAVQDPPQSLTAEDAGAFVSADFGDHESVALFKQVKNYMAWFFGAGYFTKSAAAGDRTITELIKSGGSSYVQSTSAPTPPTGQDGEPEVAAPTTARTDGPFAVAMISSTTEKDPAKEDEETADQAKSDETPDPTRIRIAAFGDGEFVANIWQQAPTVNYNIGANVIAWLTDTTELVGIRAKDPTKDMEERKITVDEKGRRWLVVLTLLFPLALILLAGLVVRITRR